VAISVHLLSLLDRCPNPLGHFRHSQRANVTFADGHVGRETMVPGSLDPKLPGQFIGQLRPEILKLP
jgi:prepilin-type processing-associated H-X9-DG protein